MHGRRSGLRSGVNAFFFNVLATSAFRGERAFTPPEFDPKTRSGVNADISMT
jgi:hypothetical protein